MRERERERERERRTKRTFLCASSSIFTIKSNGERERWREDAKTKRTSGREREDES
jgi:hypothetical protein